MARFNFLINNNESDFVVEKKPEISTDCSTVYEYVITSEDGNTILLRADDAGSFIENGKYIVNGVESSFDGVQISLTYSSPITVTFSLQNSGVPGFFNNVTFHAEDSTIVSGFNSYSDYVERQNDSQRCDVNPGFVTNFDELSDTPPSKAGFDGFIPVVNESSNELEYKNPLDIFVPNEAPIENEYPDIASMLADQANQTEKYIQFVLDGSADPTVTTGDAYYEKLSTSTGTLSDYRKLADEEVIVLKNNRGYKIFDIEKVEDDSSPITSVRGGRVGVEYNGSNSLVTGFFFNKRYSSAIQNVVLRSSDLEYYLRVYNQTSRKEHIVSVTGFQTVNSDYILASVEEFTLESELSIGDRVEIYFDIDSSTGGGGEAKLDQEVFQAGHGLVVGDVVRMDNSIYVKAQSNTIENAVGIGIVVTQNDADNFKYQYGGLSLVNFGLSDGEEAFLQDDGTIGTTPGTINLYLGTQTPQGFLIEIGQGFLSDDVDSSFVNQALMFSASGIDDDLEVGLVSNDDFEIPFDINSLTIPSARVTEAPVDADIIIDLLSNGVSILSTPITIENGSNSSLDAATQPVLNISSLSKGDVITRNITQVGSTNPGKNLKITLAYEAQANVSGGGGELEYQAEITTSTTLTTQEGLNKVYPVNSSSDIVITVPQGVYSENDVINFERRGGGSVEFVGANNNVRLRGVRDVENRYFINDEFSWVSLICRGGNEFSIVGRLKGGYTGAVTTSNYTILTDIASPQDVTVTGSGFSNNMLVTLAGNATLNSFTVNNQSECVLNITPSGSDGDLITVEYDNGNVFTDTDAITISGGVSYDTADLRAYWRLITDSVDYKNSLNGSDTSITYSSGAVFDGSTSNIQVSDDDLLSWGNGSTDNDLSISFTINSDSLSSGTLFMKRDPATSSFNEYQVDVDSNALRILFFSQNSPSNFIFRSYTGILNSTTSSFNRFRFGHLCSNE